VPLPPPPPPEFILRNEKKPIRPTSAIQADLDAAVSLLRETEPKVRDNRTLVERRQAAWDKAKATWDRSNPGDAFDPVLVNQPEKRPAIDADLNYRFHRQHYVVAGYEKELAEAKEAGYAV
jgi:hypothetical protein